MNNPYERKHEFSIQVGKLEEYKPVFCQEFANMSKEEVIEAISEIGVTWKTNVDGHLNWINWEDYHRDIDLRKHLAWMEKMEAGEDITVADTAMSHIANKGRDTFLNGPKYVEFAVNITFKD